MADYHAILKRAIGALPEPTGEARRSVYEKARTALVNQLKSFDPPLSASEITQQRLQLEDAIRKVEAEAAKSILNQALNRTPTSPTRPPPPAATPPTATPPAAAAGAGSPPAAAGSASSTAAAGSGSSTAAAGPNSPPAATGPGSSTAATGPGSSTAATGPGSSAAATGAAGSRPPAAASPAAAKPSADRPAEPTRPTAPPRPSVAPPSARDIGAAKPAPERAPPAAAKGRAEPAVVEPTAPAATPEKLPAGAEVRPTRPGFDRMRARGKAEPAAGSAAGTAAEAKGAPADPAATPLRGVIDEADKLGAATAETARQAREALSAAGGMVDGEGRGGKGRSRSERRAARRGHRDETEAGDKKPTRLPLFVGLAAATLVVAVAGGAVWTMRDEIAGYFGADRPIAGFSGRNEKSLPPKSTDRLLADGGQAGKPAGAGDGVKVVTTEPIAPAAPPKPPSATLPAPPARPADPAVTATTPPPAAAPGVAAAPIPAAPPPVPTAPVPPVAQKVSLLEEGSPGGGQSTVTEGKVIWQTVREPPQPGRQPVTIVRARVEVPGRGLVLNLAFQPNTDTSFPASHLIELRFEVPPDFDHKGISNVPGLILKTTEQARGDPLVGAAARISSNFFWIALSSPEADKVRNIALLKDRGWIDVPMLYEDGRRAIMTLEKAGAGDRVVAEAVEAWGQGG